MTEVEKATSRANYLSPEEAIQFGLIDKVLYPEDLRVQVSSGMCAACMLQCSWFARLPSFSILISFFFF